MEDSKTGAREGWKGGRLEGRKAVASGEERKMGRVEGGKIV